MFSIHSLALDLSSYNSNNHPHYQLLTEEKVREMIESAYPNPLSLPDIAATTCSNQEDVERLVTDLCAKGVARLTDLGQVKRVSQMPKVIRSQQPTVAIITAQFCEKLAVDAMIDNKDTYVRYKGEGESNVYTLGTIGQHRVVATKLPAVGNSRSAMIAAGNTTTRLLGTFQHVEYVFLVGIGGGVPHYTDYHQHVRLGDIVVSTSPRRNHLGHNGHNGHNGNNSQKLPTRSDFIYVHCEKLRSSPDEPMNASNSSWKELQTVDSFNYRFWCPLSLELQDIARQIYHESQDDVGGEPSWERYIEEARHRLQESDDLEFIRPAENTDKLYMSIGTNDVIEMAHPEPDPQDVLDEQTDPRKRGMPKIHFGAVGSGRLAVGNEQLRQDIALKFGIKAFDIEFDTVIESIFGNRKDRYIIIRGIADYKDGSRKKEWQPFAALSAAAYMKAILCRLEPIAD
ncbi:UDP Phosphorylase-like protein [Euroglyphus maynei]|uniref:UDP Phosphorylase-like protein n=1 Tax=Euroglyphus maynei TaxID=6958 RepID=A0A1Y3BAU2_EURMA|nr:UDP Phosphorylase-like protein [Euroglyphus maynei]